MSANTKTVIANLAISHLGINKNISNFDTDKSSEGNAVRQFYETSLEQVLSQFRWSFARAYVKLALVQSNPTCEWGYSYRYPSNCLLVRRILSGLRTDTHQSRVPFLIGTDAAGGLIYTDMAKAEIEYTFLQQDTSKFTSEFAMSLSLKIAYMIAPQITAGDPFKMRDSIQALYMKSLDQAESNIATEEQPDRDIESEFIRSRGAGAGWTNWQSRWWRMGP